MSGQVKTFSDINITPLTDIFLVLLIIMMVVAPLMNQTDASIKIPQVSSGTNVDPNRSHVEVNGKGQFFVNSKLTPAGQLAAAIKTDSGKFEDKNLVIRADKLTPSKDVIAVMQAAREAGLEKVTVAGEPLSNSRASELSASQAASPQPSAALEDQ